MQCSAGELAVRKAVTNQSQTYYFDIEKCKQCPHREGCYKEGAKSKTFSVTLKSYNQKLWIGKNSLRQKKRFESDKMYLPQNNKPKETSYGYSTTNDRKRKHTLL